MLSEGERRAKTLVLQEVYKFFKKYRKKNGFIGSCGNQYIVNRYTSIHDFF